MKRRIITTVTVCVFLALVLAVRLSDREKNNNSIPSKETVAAYILEKGEQYAAEQLRGQEQCPPQLGRPGCHAVRDLGRCVGP